MKTPLPKFIDGKLQAVILPSKPYRKGHHIKVTTYSNGQPTIISHYSPLPFTLFLIQRDGAIEVQKRTCVGFGTRNGAEKQLSLF